MSDAPPIISELVERFALNSEIYLSQKYNEEQARHEFINPMFEALGWDMSNKQGYSDVYKDVVYEEALEAGAPDYSFRIGSVRKFFLEAKAPNVNIATHWPSAVQLRSYAWSNKIPISILTNFAHFSVYDGRVPIRSQIPKVTEARVKLIAYTEYLARWDEIESVFSKQAILKGFFDRFAESVKDNRETVPVDEAFLTQISRWRDRLARMMRRDNPNISAAELNFAVQMTIDRIVFLRIAEDRGIESYGYLNTLSKVTHVYSALFQYFQAADAKYNSGLFHFRMEKDRSSSPDNVTPDLVIDDGVLRQIIKDLYPPVSHYRFSYVPAEILGQVYEQFLGKEIVLKEKGVRVEDKPEVRKAGGVYYTPAYIVDYIIKHTLGKMLVDKTPDDVARLKILDPASGSGSFLLGAYQELLDWHLDYYYHHDPEALAKRKSPPIRQIPSTAAEPSLFAKPSYRLTISERKRILLNNIHGVDIDTQAVEVTKLSLLLKCLEGETAESIEPLFKVLRERALPDLEDNIKCGNSLIAPDISDSDRFPGIDAHEMAKINAFDWSSAFSKARRAGGFDVIIGNPPYLYSAGQQHIAYFEENFRLAEYQTDFYVYFLEKALKLAKVGGVVSFIISDSWLNSDSFSKLRRHLLTNAAIELVAVFDYPVFKVTLENSILVVRKGREPQSFPVIRFGAPDTPELASTLDPAVALKRQIIDPNFSEEAQSIAEKMQANGAGLGTISEIHRGIHAYRTDGYGRSKFGKGPQTKRDKEAESYHSTEKLDVTYLPELRGKDVSRYSHVSSGRYLSYGTWLAEPRDPKFVFRPKIVVRKILGRKLHGMFIAEPIAVDQSLYIIILKDDDLAKLRFVLGILLSSTGAWWLRTKFAIYDKLYPWYTKKQLASFPIPAYDARVSQRVERMIRLYAELGMTKLDTAKRRIEREISSVDQQVDRLVYELYKLTDDEIQFVEMQIGHAK